MMYEADEREDDLPGVRHRLEAQHDTGSFDLVATAELNEQPPALVGWLAVEVAAFRRARHVGCLVLGVDSESAGRGTGGALLDAAIAEASGRALRRLELTVMTDNLRASNLYLRHGFEVEGLRRQAMCRDGHLVDEYFMARLLPDR
jgi:ribosomal protein S18 acetylase RimI-like enzyme